MALDGGYLSLLCAQLQTAVGAKVDKVYMPFKDQVVLGLRGRDQDGRLIITTKSDAARIHFTKNQYENPPTPPMLCMLLRKLLTGARVTSVRQDGLERVLFIEMLGHNELGDEVTMTLCVEIMGRHSNAILVNQNGRIIDSLKRVDETVSSVRPILPGLPYTLPPKQDKQPITQLSGEECVAKMRLQRPEAKPSDALLKTVSGVSPTVCRQLCYDALGETACAMCELTGEQCKAIALSIDRATALLRQQKASCCCVYDAGGMPVDFSFVPLSGYGEGARVVTYDDPSALLDDFYRDREHRERQHQKSADLFALVKGLIDRTAHKLAAQQAELEGCEKSDLYRVYGELITANLYRMQKGDTTLIAQNYFEPDCPELEVPLSAEYSPQQNAQRYFKLYRKAQTARVELTRQIEQGQRQLDYLETVRYALEHTVTTADIDQIRDELAEGGYVRKGSDGKRTGTKGKNQKTAVRADFLEFETDSGFTVLVGRNNRQNDLLTFKIARPDDIWLHARNIPGSHCILRTEGKTPDDATLTQAATIAAVYSSGANYPQLSVD
ncbi:MAG: NFACT family protein, partial [Clostridia bacterium]|nr:NFACT family protein [Clostridia bacterium]